MTFLLPLHVLATIIWFGGLFFLSVVLRRSAHDMDSASAMKLWNDTLSIFFVWIWMCLVLILLTGVALVFLAFGGFSGIPLVHRVNPLIGLPAMVLFIFLYFVPWRRFQHAVFGNDMPVAERNLKLIRRLMTIILALGLVASIVSVAGRNYY
jgi:uncharacterized membrane protein